MGSNESRGVYLPDEVLINILSRLPTKSLLRFRSVSKSFKNLIDQPLFILIHQSRSFSNLLIHCTNYTIKGPNFLLFDETLSNSQNLNLTSSTSTYSTISAPCDGIFAISNHEEQIGLWNLATRQFRSLPVPNRPKLPPSWNPFASDGVLGFGYDSNSNDYKVVLYRDYQDRYHLREENPPAQLLVYSLSTNSWRELDIENLNSFWEIKPGKRGYLYQSMGLSFNGVYYWFLSKDIWVPESILTFNFSDEKFREMAMPDPSLRLNCPAFAVSGGCLAIVGCYHYGKLAKVRIWVMVENECWVQKFEIGPFEGIKRPFGLWKNDYVLLETNDHKLVLGDSSGQLREIHPFGTAFCGLMQMFVYGESLVSVKGGGDHGYCSNEEDSLADFLSAASVN